MLAIKKMIKFGNHSLSIETGVVAKQATGSIMVDMDGTTVLVTVVAEKGEGIVRDFFPLRVDYQERFYAGGKIPGGFYKREGRPGERETLIARLIDRPLRPLFPKGFYNEVQIVATVVSVNPEIEPDIPALIGASAALAISGIPFQEPIAAARVGYQDGCYILNPTQKEMETSQLDLVIAGTMSSVLMVESEAKELSESVMLGAVSFGHSQMKPVIQAIEELAKKVGNESWDWQPKPSNEELISNINKQFSQNLADAYLIKDKMERQENLRELRKQAVEKFLPADSEDSSLEQISEKDIRDIVEQLESNIVRSRILQGELRIDGRSKTTIRPIDVKTKVLNRTHGSALFTRGETQALVTVTLGTLKDAQSIDSLMGAKKEHFMLHYNFPPYSVGEIGMVGSPKRREIGHGKLAKRSIEAVLPDNDSFPYVVRVVSEITESNGSSSMATVCGASLGLMDAGVPIKAPVAGIAMGLIKEGNEFAVLSDILGDEDHLGDMDFKVAGTDKGVTALQMDIKISGISEEIMSKALEQARDGRLHILTVMNDLISEPNKEVSTFAPTIMSFKINPEKIKDVIGKGGATIRGIIDETGATIDIQDDGTIQVAAETSSIGNEARRQIELLTAEVEVGMTYEGTVVRLADFGAFVNILPGRDGLVHISQIAEHRVNDVSDELAEGQVVKVKVIDIDRQGRLKLSIKALVAEEKMNIGE